MTSLILNRCDVYPNNLSKLDIIVKNDFDPEVNLLELKEELNALIEEFTHALPNGLLFQYNGIYIFGNSETSATIMITTIED